MKVSIGGAGYGAAWAARNHFRAREEKPSPIQQMWQGEREIHHRSAHAITSRAKTNREELAERAGPGMAQQRRFRGAMVTRPPERYFPATCPNGQTLPREAKTFPLQKQLIF